ncbi:universal stress protein [Pedobacter cryoconitis]|uniref:Nucleotide-binding universal stress UspA family protein n=1 Tax=Pedobacter cryoconitis TaxID=188932 RepID=A0A327T252_9SPHI|nr:universal stress protein [Pedobacter cryoconitis]RAJ35746.1 nucleotide-binding universal stress UspA family protein [Pedobacter cryoconitis]
MKKINKKSILVLTDFSKYAKNAAESALNLAIKMKMDIVLCNIYPTPTILSSTETPFPIEYDDSAKQQSIDSLKIEKIRLESILKRDTDISVIPDITIMDEDHSFSSLATLIKKEKNIMMVIMGGRHHQGNEFLFGGCINTIVNKSNCPVLLISEKALTEAVKTTIFATDLTIEDMKQLKLLTEKADLFKSHIHVCHISPPTPIVIDFNEEYHLSEFIQEMGKLTFKKISFKNIQGKNIVQDLIEFEEETHADLLVIVHKTHSFLWKLFHESSAKRLIRNQKSPLLILPG